MRVCSSKCWLAARDWRLSVARIGAPSVGFQSTQRSTCHFRLCQYQCATRPKSNICFSTKPPYLVESDNKWRLLLSQQSNRFDRLRLEAVHEIDHQNGNVTERRAARAQIRKRLVARRVDHEQARHTDLGQLLLCVAALLLGSRSVGQRLCLHLERFQRKIGGTNLLRNATRLATLHIGASDAIEQFGLCVKGSVGAKEASH